MFKNRAFQHSSSALKFFSVSETPLTSQISVIGSDFMKNRLLLKKINLYEFFPSPLAVCDRLTLPHLGANQWKWQDPKGGPSALHFTHATDKLSSSVATQDFSSYFANFLGGFSVFQGGKGRRE